MADGSNFDIAGFSAALASLAATAAARVVMVESAKETASGVIWRSGLVVTAHEGLSGDDDFTVLLPNGETVAATLVGRDPSTDVALLKADTGDFGDWAAAETPQAGSLAVVVGRGENGTIAAFGAVGEAGPAWRSMRGGLIDARLVLALRLSARAEGGAVVAPDGRLIGLAATGPRRRALAIPAATVERAVQTLSEKGYVARGYLGLSLHPRDGRHRGGNRAGRAGCKSRLGGWRYHHHMGRCGGGLGRCGIAATGNRCSRAHCETGPAERRKCNRA